MTLPKLRRGGACTAFDATPRYRVTDGEFAAALAEQRFRTIENAASEETSIGWTTPPDPSGGSFEVDDFVVGGEAAWLRVRVDRKRLPSKLVEQHVAAAERAQAGRRLTARERRQLKADLAEKLLPRVLPATTYLDVLIEGCRVVVLTSSKSAIEAVQKLWWETFGVSLTRLVPSEMVPEERAAKFAPTVFAGHRQREIPGAKPADFLGCEMLAWLWWLSDTGAGEIKCTASGSGRKVTVFVDELAEWREDDAVDVVLRGGFVSREPEARAALRRGRVPTSLRLQLLEGLGTEQAVLTIRGATLTLSSVQLPPDPEDCDPEDRNESRLTDWIRLTRNVADLFQQFVHVRERKTWLKKEAAEIGAWMRS